jgi:hypothetical protein
MAHGHLNGVPRTGDLDAKGLIEYQFDIIYITAFVQLTSIISDWFWAIYAVVCCA